MRNGRTDTISAPLVPIAAAVTPPPIPVLPTTATSRRADVAVSRLLGAAFEVSVLVNTRHVGCTGTDAVELLRALVAVLPRCRYCGQPCEAEFCSDTDCDRLHRGSETAIREGWESQPLGFTPAGRAA
jgi:hypothetical protein